MVSAASTTTAVEPTTVVHSSNYNHNLNERQRRLKMNQKIQELKDLLPKEVANTLTNKLAILQESVEYVKSLQSLLAQCKEKIQSLEQQLSTYSNSLCNPTNYSTTVPNNNTTNSNIHQMGHTNSTSTANNSSENHSNHHHHHQNGFGSHDTRSNMNINININNSGINNIMSNNKGIIINHMNGSHSTDDQCQLPYQTLPPIPNGSNSHIGGYSHSNSHGNEYPRPVIPLRNSNNNLTPILPPIFGLRNVNDDDEKKNNTTTSTCNGNNATDTNNTTTTTSNHNIENNTM